MVAMIHPPRRQPGGSPQTVRLVLSRLADLLRAEGRDHITVDELDAAAKEER